MSKSLGISLLALATFVSSATVHNSSSIHAILSANQHSANKFASLDIVENLNLFSLRSSGAKSNDILFISLLSDLLPIPLHSSLYFISEFAKNPDLNTPFSWSFLSIINEKALDYFYTEFQKQSITFPIPVTTIPTKNLNSKYQCASLASSGVNLDLNFNFMWDTYLPEVDPADPSFKRSTLFETPCEANFHGDKPFSEVETTNLKNLILKLKPKLVVFLRQNVPANDEDFNVSKLVFPYKFHPKPKTYMNELDSNVYENMQNILNDARDDFRWSYKAGTQYGFFGETLPGSLIDWTFDQAGIWAVELHLAGMAKYWTEDFNFEEISEKHFKPLMALAKHSRSLTTKQTPKHQTIIRHALKAVTIGPFFLGFILLIILGIAYIIARFWLGYDNIWTRFTKLVDGVKLWNLRRNYVGVETEDNEFESSNIHSGARPGDVELAMARKQRRRDLFIVDEDDNEQVEDEDEMEELAEIWRNELEGVRNRG
ncbi:hypothetical protein HK096_003916, partial [Nowakowskiella sp. JEL0078]